MLLKFKSPDIMERLLAKAVRGKDTLGRDAVFLRCEFHGFMKQADLKSGFTRRMNCSQCVAIGFFYRRALSIVHLPDEQAPPELEQMAETLEKAVQMTEKGKLDLEIFRHPKIMFGKEAAEYLEKLEAEAIN